MSEDQQGLDGNSALGCLGLLFLVAVLVYLAVTLL